MKSVADQLREEGKKEARRQTIKNMLKSGLNKERVAELLETSVEKVNNIQENLET